jgi:hypothetical protein
MRKALVSSVLLLLLLGAATGCGRYYWSKPGSTAQQFTQDNQTCLQQAVASAPAGSASPDSVRHAYRACLNGRGYVRDKQIEPPPAGFYRGIEKSEEFNAAAQAAMAQAPRQTFDQQLAQLDDLKARGRITEDEYATIRKRLVEGVTPGALTPAPAVAAPAAAATPPRSVAGRWYGRDRAVLDIRSDGQRLDWDWELVTDRATIRAAGTGSVSGNEVALTGRATGILAGGYPQPVAFALTWDGATTLRGTYTNPSNLPRGVMFTRDRP